MAPRFGSGALGRLVPRTIRFKMAALFATFVGLMGLFIVVWFPARLEKQALAALRDKAHSVAAMTAFAARSAVLFDDRVAMKEALRGALAIPDLSYASLTDTAGKVLTWVASEPHERGAAHSTPDAPLLNHIHRVTTPVALNGDTLGTVHVGISLLGIRAARDEAQRVGVFVGLLMFILGTGVVGALSVVVTDPLRRMVGTAERIADGDLSQRVQASSGDEVGQLATAFNKMIAHLESAHTTQRMANEDLEARVRQRTRRLREEIAERKRATETLARSEARYRSLVDHATYGIYRTNAEGKFVSANPALVAMLGYDSADELAALDLARDVYLDPTERAHLIERFRDTTTVTDVEVQWKRKDGHPLTVRVSARLFRDADDRLVGTEGVVEDVTERKRAERALRDSEERLKALFESAPDALYLQDLRGRLIEGNPAAERLTGYTRAELTGKNILELALLSNEHLAKARHLIERNAGGESTGPDELTIMRRDGRAVEVEVRSFPVRIKGEQLALVLARDITDRKRAEAAMREQEQMIRDLVETSKDWIWAIDKEGFHTYCNPAVATILGYQPEELEGKLSLLFMHEDDRRLVESMLPGCAAEKKGWRNTLIRWRHKSGGYRYLESTAVPILDATGELCGFRGVDRDVTERRQIEEQLRQAQKMEAVGELTGGIAHDFNNLLSVIIMNLAMARHSIEQGAPVTVSELQDAEHAARRASVMTKQLLGFSRQAELTLCPTNLADLIRRFRGILRRVLPENIELEVAYGTLSSIALADRGAVEQILLNLAANARDAMPAGGRLSIELDATVLDDTYQATHPWVRPGPFVKVSVSDTGTGMSPETQRRLFEPFYTTKPVGKGTGLGMAMVYGLIKQHSGHVNLYTEPGEGTTFHLYFPACSEEREPSATPHPVALQGGTETILLVEDEAALRRAAQRVLTRHGYRVITATNGEEALAIHRRERDTIDLVVSDAVMPRMGGAELFQHILQESPDTKVLLVSGYTGREVQARTGAKQHVPYLQKPWTLAALLQQVRALLDVSPARAE